MPRHSVPLISTLFIWLLLTAPALFGKDVSERLEGFWAHRYMVSPNVLYGEHEAQRLDIYSQGRMVGEPTYWKRDDVKYPTVIFIHGGGWTGGAKETRLPFILPYLERGWNAVNVEYRVGENTAPQAVDDVMRAIQWIADHAEDYNIDRQKLVISGDSAGGHLALISGLLNSISGSHDCFVGDRVKVKAVVNWYGITDIAKVASYLTEHRPKGNYAERWINGPDQIPVISKRYSPVGKITSAAPPIITIHGQMDTVVPYEQAVALHERLNEAGVKNELISIPTGRHQGFAEEDIQDIYKRIFQFLDEVFRAG